MANNFTPYSSSIHYNSATSFFTDGDQTTLFVPGLRVRFVQVVSFVDTTKYAEVLSSSYSSSTLKTTVTVRLSSQYTIANSAISNPAYTFDLLASSQEPSFFPSTKVVKVPLTAGNTNAFAFAWQNPEATKIMVHKVLIDITTAGGTGSSVLDVGIVADATSTADTLIDGLDLNAAALSDNITEKGTNGKSRGKVDELGGTNDYITGKILAQNAASLVANAYIHYSAV